jgi:hypothetical protein
MAAEDLATCHHLDYLSCNSVLMAAGRFDHLLLAGHYLDYPSDNSVLMAAEDLAKCFFLATI